MSQHLRLQKYAILERFRVGVEGDNKYGDNHTQTCQSEGNENSLLERTKRPDSFSPVFYPLNILVFCFCSQLFAPCEWFDRYVTPYNQYVFLFIGIGKGDDFTIQDGTSGFELRQVVQLSIRGKCSELNQ